MKRKLIFYVWHMLKNKNPFLLAILIGITIADFFNIDFIIKNKESATQTIRSKEVIQKNEKPSKNSNKQKFDKTNNSNVAGSPNQRSRNIQTNKDKNARMLLKNPPPHIYKDFYMGPGSNGNDEELNGFADKAFDEYLITLKDAGINNEDIEAFIEEHEASSSHTKDTNESNENDEQVEISVQTIIDDYEASLSESIEDDESIRQMVSDMKEQLVGDFEQPNEEPHLPEDPY